MFNDEKDLEFNQFPELGNLLCGHSYGEFHIDDRSKFQEKFWELLELGFDSYGYIENKDLEKYIVTKTSKFCNKDIYPEDSKCVLENPYYQSHIHVFDNGTFMINPYYWGDAEDLMDIPNFIYYPENIEIRWYKYAFRDSYCNKNISYEDFCKIVDKCKESLMEEEI